MNNAWMIFNAAGQLVARGEGRMPHLQEGEYFDWHDDIESVNQSAHALDDDAREAARDELERANRSRSHQAYINKTACAKEFLANVPDTGVIGDPSVIPAECKDLFDEYSETHDLIDISPWDLARKIVAKSDKSQTEAQRRRKKLLAQQVLQQSLPEPPSE